MKQYDYAQTCELLPYPRLARAIAATLKRKSQGRASGPDRAQLPLAGGGLLLAMPAADQDIAITKLVTVHPHNPDQGLPTIQGEVIVMDAANGQRIGMLDGQAVTARRTASLSLLAAQALAPEPGPLLLVGAGAQARAHLEAFREGFGIKEVHIVSRTSKSAETLAAHARSLGMEAIVDSSPAKALPWVTLIVTATPSLAPVLPDSLPERVFVSAVGAHAPHMAELSPALLRQASIYVDTREGACEEAGDLLQAELGPNDVVPLEDMLDGRRPGRGPVVFKSTGHALFDLAAARLALGYED